MLALLESITNDTNASEGPTTRMNPRMANTLGRIVAGCAPEAGAEEGAETPAAADEAMGEGEGE
jgi:hypothetical protein